MNHIINKILLTYQHSGSNPVEIMKYNRDDLANTFCELGYKVGAEIGVEKGKYSQVLCQSIPGLKLFCIDPWEHYSGYREHIANEEITSYMKEATERLVGYDANFIRAYSADALNLIDDSTLDFVYIDANHQFEHVAFDVANWSKKVRSGGIVAGHDYKKFKRWQNNSHVIEAINGYTHSYGIKDWYVIDKVSCDGREQAGTFFWFKK